MHRREFIQASMVTVLAGCASTTKTAAPDVTPDATVDAFVYGSTPGGVAAAIEAARRRCKVLLACPKRHPGGMTASGLSTTDAVRRDIFGGLVAEFIAGVRREYGRILPADSPDMKLTQDGWFYEPSVAQAVFEQMIAAERARLTHLPERWLVSAKVGGDRVTHVVIEDKAGKRSTIAARTFIDGTYEGDLAAAAGVPCRVGREAEAEFGEPFAGIRYMNWRTGEHIPTRDTGDASPAIQAFCYRIIWTIDPAHRLPIPRPANYDEHLHDYLPLLGDYERKRISSTGPGAALPRQKFQMNGSIEAMTSSNCPGMSWTYPEATYAHRERLDKWHMDHALGLAWFLQNDKRVPAKVASRWRNIGLHDQEFKDNGHLPWQLYVRQGRRIEGRAIVTQHNFMVDKTTGRTPSVKQPIAIGEHSFDVHPCHDRRYAVDGWMEGVLWYPRKALGPAQPGQVPYGAMLPRKLNNLLAPVPLSSTHVAMSVLRMEPLWMTTGQTAGLAAAMAMDKRMDAANLDPAVMPGMLKVRVDPYA